MHLHRGERLSNRDTHYAETLHYYKRERDEVLGSELDMIGSPLEWPDIGGLLGLFLGFRWYYWYWCRGFGNELMPASMLKHLNASFSFFHSQPDHVEPSRRGSDEHAKEVV